MTRKIITTSFKTEENVEVCAAVAKKEIAYQNKDIAAKTFTELFPKESFLSQMDSEEMRNRLTSKIKRKEALTNKELMEFVILPLTYAGKEKKQEIIEELFSEVKQIGDAKTQVFLTAGVMVFADKVIDKEVAERMKRWIMMTKVSQLFEDEKQEELRKQKKEVTIEVKKETAKKLKEKNVSLDIIQECTGLETQEIAML